MSANIGANFSELTKPQIVSLFHSRNGLYFGRLSDGTVRIIVTKNKEALNEDNSNVIFEQDIEASIWGSVVSSVSKDGETYDRWIAAQNFHNKE